MNLKFKLPKLNRTANFDANFDSVAGLAPRKEARATLADAEARKLGAPR